MDSSLPGSCFGHADDEAFAEPARLTRRPVLFIDDALAPILAFVNLRQVVVRSPEKRL